MKRLQSLMLLCIMILAPMVAYPAVAQETAEPLRISLSRDFGTSIGSRISGTFSIRVSNPPANVARVVFQLNGATIGEDTDAPFRLQFRTTSYPPGPTDISAIAYAADGSQIASGTLTRTFMSGSESGSAIAWVILPILILTVAGLLITNWIANRNNDGTPAVSGLLGGAICPNCGRPFAIHIWSLNLAVFRLDRCPHCGKWVRVTRASDSALREAADAWAKTSSETPPPPADSPSDNDIRRRLDDSRFDN